MNKIGFKPIPAAIALGLALLIWFVIPVPDGVTPQAWHLLAMFVGVIAAIIGKAMPIGALSIIAVMLVAVTQVTVPELGADGNPIKKPAEMAIKDALSSFADPLIWLIGISIMISRGILKTGLGARIGYYFISLFGKKTLGIGYSLALSELILAPVTPSNTARGGGIIHPVMKAISSSYDSDPEKGTQGRIGRYLALVNYHSNPITSAMFITATGLGGNVPDAAGAVFRLSARNQGNPQRGTVCQRPPEGAGADEPRRENHVGDFCRIAGFVGGHSGHDFRQSLYRPSYRYRLYRPVAAAFVGRADLG